MTMFEDVTRALTRKLNPGGDLTPLDSLIDFKRFRPFCLVLRKRKSTLKLSAGHPFLKEMRERKKNLYVVMEVVEAKQEVTLEQTGNANAIFSLPSFALLGLQGSMNHKEAVTIPKDCVLAYRVRQLMVCFNNHWDIPHICDDSMQTFFKPRAMPHSAMPHSAMPHIAKPLRLPLSPAQMIFDFKTLKEEVQRETQAVKKLSPVGRSSLLTSLSHLLGKKKELQELEQKLEGALDKGHKVTLEALPKEVLLSKDAMDAILYFLGALTELSEEQLMILVKSLEKKILSVQLKLVESTLEKNFLQEKEIVFPLQPDLLSSLGEEELILTEALVGLSGLKVQRSGPRYTWDPDTRPHLCALYAGLSLLQLLSKDS
ncbi:gasdermin-A-like [Mus pahari]|uniref:gasdermin-A-like n=1 Tax=Mus pahari TaxID=10093 RepID=UPI000A30F558|nr:gasdermin-A-like [Mus pahari]